MLLQGKLNAIGGENQCYCNYLKYNGKQISNNQKKRRGLEMF